MGNEKFTDIFPTNKKLLKKIEPTNYQFKSQWQKFIQSFSIYCICCNLKEQSLSRIHIYFKLQLSILNLNTTHTYHGLTTILRCLFVCSSYPYFGTFKDSRETSSWYQRKNRRFFLYFSINWILYLCNQY